MMRNLSESDARTVRLGAIAAAFIVVFMVATAGYDYLERLDKDRRTAEKKLSDIQNGISSAGKATEALTEVRKVASVYPDRLALNQQTARMREQVEGLPGYAGLSVERLEDLPLRNDDPLYRSGVSLQFNGSLPSLHRFLQGVEAASPALRVERLTLSTQQKNNARVVGQMTISGYAVVLAKGNRG